MNIEILGVDPKNKGAALMLEALRVRFTEHYPNARFCVSLSYDTVARVNSGLWAILPKQTKKKELVSVTLENLLPSGLLKKLGIVKSSDINIVVDASGFAYGDFWGAKKLEKRLGANVENWKKDGKKIIVLPQAWGPFKEPGFKNSLSKVIRNVDILFARDNQSYGFIEDLSGQQNNVFQAPDFTNVLKVPLKENLQKYKNSTFVIPNEKVIESFGEEARNDYLSFLALSCDQLLEAGHKVVMLIHEGSKDLKLAEAILAKSKSGKEAIEVLNLVSPLDTKAVIANSRAIVSSRFHGLVSALSSGVPSLACGWSHKYEELLSDYSCSDYVVDFRNKELSAKALSDFISKIETDSFRSEIKSASLKQKELTEDMWKKVFQRIEK
ncbi:MAG: hypothetical protein CL579_09690 [Alteromonadaceae bacterium]|nr:hypothetical protein [Alteromonadaceae bacterium]